MSTEAIAEAIAAEVSEQIAEAETAEAMTEAAEAMTEAAEAIAEAAETIAEAADEATPEAEAMEAEASILLILNRQTEILTEIRTMLESRELNELDEVEASDLEAPLEIVLPMEAQEVEAEPEHKKDWITSLLFG